MSIGHFLGGVAGLIYDPTSKRYLLLRRSTSRDFQPDAWECVAGRVEQGESFEQALIREVREEIGVDATIEFIVGTTHFFRGVLDPVNELLGVIYACSIKDSSQITSSDEHSELRWVTGEEAIKMLPEKHWLRRVIQKTDILRRGIPDWLAEVFQRDGFEI